MKNGKVVMILKSYNIKYYKGLGTSVQKKLKNILATWKIN